MLTSIKKKIFKTLLIAVIFITAISLKSFAIVKPTTEFYVNDYANLLNQNTKNYIINANKQLYSQTGAQIVVVTVQNLEGNSLEDYANQLFRNFGIGDKNKNNGVLLLLALEERQFRVEVGYGLEGILPDGKTGRIQDEYIIPYLKQNNGNDGIKNGFSAILEIVADEYGVQVDSQTAIAGQSDFDTEEFTGFPFVGIPIISYIAGTIARSVKKNSNKLFYIIYLLIIGAIYLIFNLAGSLIVAIIMIIINLIALLAGRFRYTYLWRILWRTEEVHLGAVRLEEDLSAEEDLLAEVEAQEAFKNNKENSI